MTLWLLSGGEFDFVACLKLRSAKGAEKNRLIEPTNPLVGLDAPDRQKQYTGTFLGERNHCPGRVSASPIMSLQHVPNNF
jgi:hypothetical protein